MTNIYIRTLLPLLTVGYFWLWGYYSDWNLYDMVFHYEPGILGAMARLTVGFFLVVACAMSFTGERAK